MSFNIALSGLDATNQELNTISNNIANASTDGFKGSRTEFASVYNGLQPGGVEVANVSQDFDVNGTIKNTGRSMDLAINGGGFFVTKDNMGQQVYTRAGVFNTDKDNYIVSNTGSKLQGYAVDADNNLLSGNMSNIQIKTASLEAKATDRLGFVANFDATAKVIDQRKNPFDPNNPASFNSSYTSKVFDSLGNPHTITQYFTKTDANNWEVNVQVDGSPQPVNTVDVAFNPDGSLSQPQEPFNINFPAAGAEDMNVAINLKGSTQFGAAFSVSSNTPNGYTSGDLTGIRIEDNGMVYASYTNGQSQLQGQVVMADFANPQGLTKINGTAWSQSFSSGSPVIGVPGTGTLGKLTPGALEGSNVDLTGELVDLMTAQRNYQANAKTISTNDKLTQALFNAI